MDLLKFYITTISTFYIITIMTDIITMMLMTITMLGRIWMSMRSGNNTDGEGRDLTNLNRGWGVSESKNKEEWRHGTDEKEWDGGNKTRREGRTGRIGREDMGE